MSRDVLELVATDSQVYFLVALAWVLDFSVLGILFLIDLWLDAEKEVKP
jgi:hypothetical protein